MKLTAFCLAIFLMAGSPLAAAAPPAESTKVEQDNTELRNLFEADQADRAAASPDWNAIITRDAERRARVADLLRQGHLRTGNDYRHAAFIFQHGGDADAYRLAHALATIAMHLEDSAQNRWIVAASWDRLMSEHLQPQWYGTQSRGDSRGLYLYPVDEAALSEAQRRHMIGHSLAETHERVRQIAVQVGQPVREPVPTIEELRAEARASQAEED